MVARLRGCFFDEQRDELQRVGAGAVYGGAPVEVRAGDAASGADFAEEGAGVDKVAGLHGDRLEVGVEGVEAEAMVKDDGVAGEIEWLGEKPPDPLGRVHGGARGGGKNRARRGGAC